MIGFAGLSHLGINTSIGIASKGFDVLGYDANPTAVTQLRAGTLPVHEPGLQECYEKNKGHIRFTDKLDDLRTCEVVYVSLDVPTDEHNSSDLGPIEILLQNLATVLVPSTTVVILAQVKPGFTRKMSRRFPSLALVYQVETLIFGQALERVLRPERYIIGKSTKSRVLPAALTKVLSAFDCPILAMNYESAELAKIAINFCLVSSISVANTLSSVCESIGADWADVVPALKLDKRIGQFAYLDPGLGLSGGNLERDLTTIKVISEEVGCRSEVVGAWFSNSELQRNWPLKKLQEMILNQGCSNPRIGVWGIAYKKDTHSIKNSPSVWLLSHLAPHFQINAYDPQARFPELNPGPIQTKTATEAASECDVLLVMTPWDEFKTADLTNLKAMMRGKTIIDPFATLNAQRCKELGFEICQLGRPSGLEVHHEH